MEYRVERWKDIEGEIFELVTRHWQEIALDRDRIPLDIDRDEYARKEAFGWLKIITAREKDKLVGYYACVVGPHPHYRSTLFSLVDAYFIAPEYRQGPAGVGLFLFLESEMRRLGVKSMIASSKLHYDVSPLFRRLGWKQVGNLYQKWIGD